MNYFLIRSGEDGISIDQLSEKQLLERITPENGTTYYGNILKFLDHLPETDRGFWYKEEGNSILIIKGEIIKPKAVQVVTKFELS